MYCLNCDRLINDLITYKNIFKISKDHICERCLLNLTFDQKVETIPIDNYVIYLNPIFKDNNYNNLSLMSFLKPYYLYFLKNKFDLILYFDAFNEDVYRILEPLNLGNIFLLVLKNENKKGE